VSVRERTTHVCTRRRTFSFSNRLDMVGAISNAQTHTPLVVKANCGIMASQPWHKPLSLIDRMFGESNPSGSVSGESGTSGPVTTGVTQLPANLQGDADDAPIKRAPVWLYLLPVAGAPLAHNLMTLSHAYPAQKKLLLGGVVAATATMVFNRLYLMADAGYACAEGEIVERTALGVRTSSQHRDAPASAAGAATAMR
jgi:hypothetical protein